MKTVNSIGFAVAVAVLGAAARADAAPYCLLRKPFVPAQPNCFEFYLADTAVLPPRTMATPGCAATPYAQGQGWSVDPNFGGPHATWPAGDLAMHVASPYHQDFYKCHGGSDGSGGTGRGGPSSGGSGGGPTCLEASRFDQPESRDPAGPQRITVEAAIVHVMDCPSGQLYIYEYLARAGFRVIRPDNWAEPIGGRDVESFDEAFKVAMGAQGSSSPPRKPLDGKPRRPAIFNWSTLSSKSRRQSLNGRKWSVPEPSP